MAAYLCQFCNKVVTYGKNHQCLSSKRFDNVRTEIQLDGFEKCTLVHQNDNEKSKQMNSDQIENNENVSFNYSSKRTLKYNSMSDETSNSALNINSPDNLLLSPILSICVNEDHFEKCASNKASSEKFKIDCESESGFPGVYQRELSTSRFISEKKEDWSTNFSFVHGAFDEESQILIEESKCHSFKKDKNIFLESQNFAIKKERLVSKNTSESSNSHFKPDFLPGSKESNEISGETTNRPVLHEAAYEVRRKNENIATNVMETPDIAENANVVAGPSGIRPYFLKQAGKKIGCGVCNKEFARSVDFDSHCKTHTCEKRFGCDICKKRFSQKGILKRHYRSHTGEKPFVCQVCNRKFTQKEHLDKHHRTHTGEKPFLCKICKRGFTQKEHLDKHHRTHTGEKPFVCDVCKREFAKKGNLDRHCRAHTG